MGSYTLFLKFKAAGLTAEFTEPFPDVGPNSLQGLRDRDAHVRWAACQALGQMCTDLGPDLQQARHAAMLPGLMAVMDDFNAPRVQVRASTWRCTSCSSHLLC